MENTTLLGNDFNKFSEAESSIEGKLRKIMREEIQWKRDVGQSNRTPSVKCKTLEEVKQRNMELLKDMEMARARLRSRRTFSPLETVLMKAITNYRRSIESNKSA